MHAAKCTLAGMILAVSAFAAPLKIQILDQESRLEVLRESSQEVLLAQNAAPSHRPFLHPLRAPDGKGQLTEYSPGHHKHQTGIYWGFTRLNGRDFFHHPEGDYWRRQAVKVIDGEGESVAWETVYDLLDADGNTVLTETQQWTMRDFGDRYFLDLTWTGHASKDVTIGAYDYGGLFIRMPWKPGMDAEVINAARHRNAAAEGQRAMWLDVGMQVEGRDDKAHIAVLDHPDNAGFPMPWRVDGQMGVGPVRARSGDWHIAEGEIEMIRHRLIVYTGNLDDVAMTRDWSDYSGMGGTWALWGLAQKEGREATFLTPEKAVETMSIAEGFKVNAFASEPMITQPMAFCWDDRGRMWIAENRDYESRGRGFANSGDSRILILEDTDRDGVADKRSVFHEGIPFPAAIAVGFDGLWLGAPPNLLFLPDRDGDDRADEEDIEVHLTGWGIRDRHETLNSFHWGPDGWLYGCQGFATPSKVGKPAGKGELYKHGAPFPKNIELEGEGVDINGGVWRYHPIERKFEVVAHGFSNPWGMDYDAKGQLFISACVIPHLWHVIPGGIYHRQGGQHYNPYVYSDIRTIADHRHRSAHGGARVYLSDAFPERYHGQIFMANIHEHAVLTDILEPSGSGFIGRHGEDFMLANNAQWIGFSMEIGPAGDVYVLDWHDADICGKEVFNKDTGRVFRMAPEQSMATDWEGRYGDLKSLNSMQLADLQTSESAWHARRARLILQQRAHEGEMNHDVYRRLRQILNSHANPDYRLRALWAMHVTEGISDRELRRTSADPDAHIRAWTVQLLCENRAPSEISLRGLETLAQEDPSPVVRLYIASALQRIDLEDRWPIVKALARHGEDAEDHNLPKMIWFGMEPLVENAPARALNLVAQGNIPFLQRVVARRAVDADRLPSVVASLASLPEKQSAVRRSFLEGMLDGLEGRDDMEVPDQWGSVYAKLQQNEDASIQRLALELGQLFGDKAAVKQMLAALNDTEADTAIRRQALLGLASRQRDELREMLPNLLSDSSLQQDVVRATANFNHGSLSKALLERYSDFDDETRLLALQALASRPSYGRRLTQALKDETVSLSDIPPYVARQLRRVVGNSFVDVWGPMEQLSKDKEAAMEKYRRLIDGEALASADFDAGKKMFEMVCGVCHRMYDAGGEIGPDLTGSNRTNLEYLLDNVIHPSGEIQDDYKLVMITTRDGRSYAGNVASETDRQLTLRVVGETPVIQKSNIQSREVAPVSMMPEGLFNAMRDQDVLNLVAYLMQAKQ
ncbi:MAG: PmoA family protein [Verrucomicrobiota bacterium]|nr:PmoA family protein [Verrucomicrobiota bacterium]